MKTIKIIELEEIDNLDFIETDALINFAKQVGELVKENGWLPDEDEQIKRGLSTAQRDEENNKWFKKYDPIEEQAINAIFKYIKEVLSEEYE